MEFTKLKRDRSVTGGKRRHWRSGDYRIYWTAEAGYVSMLRYTLHDTIDDRIVCGWRPIGDNRTLKAAQRRCWDHSNNRR